jgi:ATP-binding cassette subfamily B protein
VPGWLASMDVAVAPYPDLPDFYFSPLKVYEYMAAGLPVVASAIGQIPDVVGHEQNGLLVEPGSVDDLAAALLRLAQDPGLGVRLGTAAAETVRAEHTWDAVAARILALAVAPAPSSSKMSRKDKSDESLQTALPGLWQILRRFKGPLQQQWRLLLLGMAAMLGVVLMRVVEPWPLKFVVDYLGGDAAAPAGLDPVAVLGAAAVAMVVAVVSRALLAYISTIAMAQAGTRVTVEIRAELYQHLLALPMSFFQRNRSAALLTAVIGDIGRLKDVAVSALLPLAVNVLTLVSMVGVMLWLNWRLTLLALCAFPLAWLTMRRMSGKIRTAARKQRKREAALASSANEALTAMPVVKIFGLQEELGRSFTAVTTKESGEDVRGRRLAARLEREVDIYIAAGTALSVFLGALMVTRNTMTLGELIIFLSYLKTAFRPLTDMAKYTGRIAKAVASGERIIALLDEPVEPDAPTAVPAPPLTGAIAFEHVTFGYTPTRAVLHDVSFSVEPGQFVALVGPSGAGKSSLAGLVGRFHEPWTGRILVDGADVRTFTRASLREQLSMVFQDSMLFGVSVGENIRYGRLDAEAGDVSAAARRANAHGFITAAEDGYDAVLGERGASLSGGQQRRIAIARAAIRHAPIVVLDEPTTGLDNATEQAVHSALAELTRDATTLLITHDLHWAQRADRIFFLDEGRICEEGTHTELMALGGRYAAMAALQTRHEREEAAHNQPPQERDAGHRAPVTVNGVHHAMVI